MAMTIPEKNKKSIFEKTRINLCVLHYQKALYLNDKEQKRIALSSISERALKTVREKKDTLHIETEFLPLADISSVATKIAFQDKLGHLFEQKMLRTFGSLMTAASKKQVAAFKQHINKKKSLMQFISK